MNLEQNLMIGRVQNKSIEVRLEVKSDKCLWMIAVEKKTWLQKQ